MDLFIDVKETNDGGYIGVGVSTSPNGDFSNLKCVSGTTDTMGIIVKYDSNLDVVAKNVFCGKGLSDFYDVVEVNDGYIAVGHSTSSDYDMAGLSKVSNGYRDAIIVKYDKNLENIIWKKSFGGSNSETFRSIIKTSNNQYVVAGNSYSNDQDLKNFNKGHQDAILVKYDNNLNLIKGFQEPVVIIDKLKTIEPNYGVSFQTSYDNIYTSNDPEIDLKNWCSSYNVNGNNNYDYGECLKPFNNDDLKLLTKIEKVDNYKEVFAGEHEYIIDNEPDNKTNWYRIFFRLINSGYITISDLKLKFEDDFVGSLQQSVEAGYLEPLVIISNIMIYSPYTERTYPNVLNIYYTGGILENSNYPVFYITLKSKSKKIKNIIFATNRDITGNQAGFNIYELRNFDMSITPGY